MGRWGRKNAAAKAAEEQAAKEAAERAKCTLWDGAQTAFVSSLPLLSKGAKSSPCAPLTSFEAWAHYLLLTFDSNGDGTITSSELFNTTEVVLRGQWRHLSSSSLSTTTSSSSSMLVAYNPDWQLCVFLCQTFGGILLVLGILSIVPGKLQHWSAKTLRWPILALTYMLILVELIVYTIIRLTIRLVETMVAKPKHRRMRKQMAEAQSYKQWFEIANQLDKSQRREKWFEDLQDGTAKYYNWRFLQELINDMRTARETNDVYLALAVIQQSTRNNVGGVMSEELYSFSHTGQPKTIVQKFFVEVVTTLHWLTEEALKGPLPSDAENGNNHGSGRDFHDAMEGDDDTIEYEFNLEKRVIGEDAKLWKSLFAEVIHNVGNSSSLTESIDALNNSMHGGSLKADADEKQIAPCESTVSTECSNVSDLSGSRYPKSHPCFNRERILSFLKRGQSAYGRTGLCLSGGAMAALYHIGVINALLEQDSLPHIISGTSAGSIIAALACTRTEEELKRDLQPEIMVDKMTAFDRPWLDRIKGLLTKGYMFETDVWLEKAKWFARDDMTFLEAYRRTGKILCVAVSSVSKKSPPVLLNYLSAPNVTIASACLASCSLPGCVPPTRLQEKDTHGVVRDQGGNHNLTYWDGSIQRDMPTQGLAEMLNCQFIIAAQSNPHIAPFFFDNKGRAGKPCRWSSGRQETSWRGGFLLAALENFLKNEMRAKFKFLRDCEIAIGFTSQAFTQDFVGSTTIVPQLRVRDFYKLLENATVDQLYDFKQGGSVSAYEHMSMIKLHYSIAKALETCIAKLESCMRIEKLRRRNESAKHPSISNGEPDSPNQANYQSDDDDYENLQNGKDVESKQKRRQKPRRRLLSRRSESPPNPANYQSDDEDYENLWNEN